MFDLAICQAFCGVARPELIEACSEQVIMRLSLAHLDSQLALQPSFETAVQLVFIPLRRNRSTPLKSIPFFKSHQRATSMLPITTCDAGV